jgi:hypothetical protein
MYEFAITHDFYPIFSSFSPIFREKTPKWVWEGRKLDPHPQITRISSNPEATPGEMLLMKREWMSVKNVWIFAKTRILHYPPL